MAKAKRQPGQLPSPPAQAKAAPSGSRLPGLEESPGSERPKWRLSRLDLEHAGSWSWGVDENALRTIVTFLTDIEQLTWTEIKAQTGGGNKWGAHKKHHAQPVATMCAEAKSRLKALKLDDLDEMFRFRLGSHRRLWGILEGDVFYPVWWDPDHKVYPMGN